MRCQGCGGEYSQGHVCSSSGVSYQYFERPWSAQHQPTKSANDPVDYNPAFQKLDEVSQVLKMISHKLDMLLERMK